MESKNSSSGAPDVVRHDAPQELNAPRSKLGSRDGPLKDLHAAKQAYHRAIAIMEEIVESVRAQTSFSVTSIEEAIAVLLQNLETRDALLVPFFSAGGRSVSPAQEAVNVCTLSVKIGMQLHYPPGELRKLGLAALLHDIAIARAPETLLKRTGSLSQAEQAALKRGPEEGAQLVRGLGTSYAAAGRGGTAGP